MVSISSYHFYPKMIQHRHSNINQNNRLRKESQFLFSQTFISVYILIIKGRYVGFRAEKIMISELLLKARDLFITEPSNTLLNISQIKTDLRLLHPIYNEAPYNPRCQHQLETFFIGYFCKDFIINTHEYMPEHNHHALFQDLKAPTYRATLTKHLSHKFPRLLHCSRLELNNESTLKELELSTFIKSEVVKIANSPPFADKVLFDNFEMVKNQFGSSEFLAMICTAILKEHCLHKHSSLVEIQLFEHGLRNAYISLCLAHKEESDTLSAFIAGFLSFISLIYLHKELQITDVHPSQDILLEALTVFLPKFNYWLGKDWGLPDEILQALRQRIIPQSDSSKLCQIIQTSDHANLTIMLGKENFINQKQTQFFLHSMHLDDFNLNTQLFNCSH